MANFQEVITKILSDADFRQSLMNNPEAALRAEGVEPTPEILEAFSGASEESLKDLASNFSKDKAAH